MTPQRVSARPEQGAFLRLGAGGLGDDLGKAELLLETVQDLLFQGGGPGGPRPRIQRDGTDQSVEGAGQAREKNVVDAGLRGTRRPDIVLNNPSPSRASVVRCLPPQSIRIRGRRGAEFVDIVAETVKVMTAVVGGVAAAVGTEIAQTVSALVRARLADSEEGRAALSTLDERPTAPESESALTAELRRQMEVDPGFAAQLEAAFTGTAPTSYSSHVTHSVLISGRAQVRRSTISLGPVTFNNTPAGRAGMVALVVALVVLLALAIYGTVRILDSDDTPSQGNPAPRANSTSQKADPPGEAASSDTSGGADGPTREDIAPLTDQASVLSVMPGTADVPVGWSQVEAPRLFETDPGDADRLNASYVARAKYADGDRSLTRFIVFAYSDEKNAQAGYALSRSGVGAANRALSMPATGDESFAYTSPESGQMLSVMRVGTVVVEVSGTGSGDHPYSGSDLQSMTELMAQRALAAQVGQSL
ncbi:hypothetical protein [Streptomyces roseolus]